MKKNLLLIGLVLAVLAVSVSAVLLIYSGSETLFYASSEEQERVYELIMSDYVIKAELEESSLAVVKESIAPMYSVDLSEYSKTGELTDRRKPTDNGRWIYIAKVITANGEFAGNLRAYIGDDFVSCNFIESYAYAVSENRSNTGWYLESWSYADHAEEIKEILGADEIIPATDVKYVTTGIGDFFFIENEQYKVLIPVGIYTANESRDMQFGFYRSVSDVQRLDEGAELKEYADNYLVLAENQVDGNTPEVYISRECNSVNNIIDINSYLGIETETTDLAGFIRYGTWTAWVMGGAAFAVLAALAVVLVRILKKTNNSKIGG